MVYDLQFLTEGHFVHHSSDFHASDEHRGVRNLYGLSVLAADFDDYDIAVFIYGVYDNAMAKYEKQRDEYTSAMQGLTLVITGAVFALYCFTSGFWEKILNLPKSMILLMFLEALLSPALLTGRGGSGLSIGTGFWSV